MSLKKYWKDSTANKFILITSFIFIILMIIFSFYDLFISRFLVNQNSQVGIFVKNFGEIPGLLIVLFSIFIFGTALKIKNKKYVKIVFLGKILSSTFILAYILKLIFNFLDFQFKAFSLIGLSIFLGLVLISLLGFYLFKQKFYLFSKKNYLFSKLTLILIFFSGAVVEILKFIWGRVRFRNLQSGFSNFTNWYSPHFFGGGHSFPSGHALLGWMLLPLILIVINKKGFKKWGTIFIIIFWGIFVSFGRVLIGAHYASDVLFSGAIAILTFLFLYKKYFLKKKDSPTRKHKSNK